MRSISEWLTGLSTVARAKQRRVSAPTKDDRPIHTVPSSFYNDWSNRNTHGTNTVPYQALPGSTSGVATCLLSSHPYSIHPYSCPYQRCNEGCNFPFKSSLKTASNVCSNRTRLLTKSQSLRTRFKTVALNLNKLRLMYLRLSWAHFDNLVVQYSRVESSLDKSCGQTTAM